MTVRSSNENNYQTLDQKFKKSADVFLQTQSWPLINFQNESQPFDESGNRNYKRKNNLFNSFLFSLSLSLAAPFLSFSQFFFQTLKVFYTKSSISNLFLLKILRSNDSTPSDWYFYWSIFLNNYNFQILLSLSCWKIRVFVVRS